MRAAVIREHGGLERLVLRGELPRPLARAGRGDRARARHVAQLPRRLHLRGMPGIRIPMPLIMGLDIAGEIDAVGPGVDGLVGRRPRARGPDRPGRRAA